MFSIVSWSLRDPAMNVYPAFLGLAAFSGLCITLATAKRLQVHTRFAWDAWFLSAAVGAWGAHTWQTLLTLLLPANAVGDPGLTAVAPGLASMGAIVMVLVTTTLVARFDSRVSHRNVDARDCFLPGLAGAEAVARLGCFSAGCCHGSPAYSLPWAVTYSEESACLFSGIPVHPTQLYQSLGCLILGGLLFRLLSIKASDRPKVSGLSLYLIGYGTLRFVTDSFRGDQSPVLGGLSLNQCLSLVLLGIGVVYTFIHGCGQTSGVPHRISGELKT